MNKKKSQLRQTIKKMKKSKSGQRNRSIKKSRKHKFSFSAYEEVDHIIINRKAKIEVINEHKIELLQNEIDAITEESKVKGENGFNIQDKEIDGKKYISFSVKEYLERMIPAFNNKL